MERKQCTLCHKLKPLEEFYRDKSTATGYTSACKPCRSRQVSRAESKRLRRSNGQVVQDSTELLEHNEKTLQSLIGSSENPSLILRTRLGEAITTKSKGVIIEDGWALIETLQGTVSKDLGRCSIHELARFLEMERIRIISREKLNV